MKPYCILVLRFLYSSGPAPQVLLPRFIMLRVQSTQKRQPQEAGARLQYDCKMTSEKRLRMNLKQIAAFTNLGRIPIIYSRTAFRLALL
jgi:hypothetical protein